MKANELRSGISVASVRADLLTRLTAGGGRPGLSDATRRQKVPLSDVDWAALVELSRVIGEDMSICPTPGQLAAVLVRDGIRRLRDGS